MKGLPKKVKSGGLKEGSFEKAFIVLPKHTKTKSKTSHIDLPKAIIVTPPDEVSVSFRSFSNHTEHNTNKNTSQNTISDRLRKRDSSVIGYDHISSPRFKKQISFDDISNKSETDKLATSKGQNIRISCQPAQNSVLVQVGNFPKSTITRDAFKPWTISEKQKPLRSKSMVTLKTNNGREFARSSVTRDDFDVVATASMRKQEIQKAKGNEKSRTKDSIKVSTIQGKSLMKSILFLVLLCISN